MARKRIEVTLTPDEHESLSTYVAHGHKSAREINRARILLLANDGHTDADIAKVLGVSHVTIYNLKGARDLCRSPDLMKKQCVVGSTQLQNRCLLRHRLF